MSEIDSAGIPRVNIKVLGVGGSGCNAVNTMIRAGLTGVEFITANTDKQALDVSLASVKIQIGQESTKGLGAGANPEVGKKAALEDAAKVSEALKGADLVFITAGMGGGTGTGAAPVLTKLAKEAGALVVAVVTKPFQFEGKKRQNAAEKGILELREHADLIIMIPNQKLISLSTAALSMIEAFKKVDEVLLNAVQGISDLISQTGLINSDFAHVRTVMQNKGLALMGLGSAEGENRAIQAAKSAISSPLLEDISIAGATNVIINITAGSDLSIQELDQTTSLIMSAVHEDADIIFGAVIDETLGNRIKVTVIATGLQEKAAKVIEADVKKPTIQKPAQAVQITAPAPQPASGATYAGQTDAKANAELASAREIAEKLGITDVTDNPFNVPSYFKRPRRDA